MVELIGVRDDRPTIDSNSRGRALIFGNRYRLRVNFVAACGSSNPNHGLSLAYGAQEPPTGPGCLHEIKHDGFRLLAHVPVCNSTCAVKHCHQRVTWRFSAHRPTRESHTLRFSRAGPKTIL